MASEFHDLLVENLPRLRAYAVVLTRNRAAADDLLQQTALKAWNGQKHFAAGTNIRAWLHQIMRNEHISSFRRSKREMVPLDAISDELLMRPGDQETKLLTREVLGAVEKLSPARREVLMMNCVAGLSYEEIADTLQCSIGTVKSRLWRAREEMQQYVYGSDEAAESDLAPDDQERKPVRRASSAQMLGA
jgi:RNA polymerase sigma-70 factor (ECF subfamily)